MISIEFSVVSGKRLHALLESIRQQTYQDYEIIIVNSDPGSRDTIRDFGAKELFIRTGKLEARKMAHEASKGQYELLLEETRILRYDALQKLASLSDPDMAIINEEEIGDGLINKLNRLDAEISFKYASPDPSNLYLIPRYYRRAVLDYSFKQAYANLPEEKIPKVVASDLEIIYTEAFKRFKGIVKVDDLLIKKYGETTIRESFSKYYRYGQTQKLLSGTCYGDFYSFRKRRRKIPEIRYLPMMIAIYAIRGSAFFLGYHLGNVKQKEK